MAKFELLYGNTNKLLKIKVEKGENLSVQAGAMVGMTPTFELKSKVGGIGKMIGRMFAGESAFIQSFTANSEGELLISPEYLGDIMEIKLDGQQRYRLGNSAYLASESGINMDLKGSGKGIFSGEGLIQMEASGNGSLFVAAYGAIHEINLGVGEEYIVDTNHLVLWNSDMNYSIEMAGGFITSITGGEGLVCHFRGPGKILIQTRNPADMVKSNTK